MGAELLHMVGQMYRQADGTDKAFHNFSNVPKNVYIRKTNHLMLLQT
jgi:hypothetical protein